MPIRYSDIEIDEMIKEKKELQDDWRSRVQMKDRSGHKERDLEIHGESGNSYRLILRQSDYNVLDFSVILAFRPPNSNYLFRLRRYNGKSHEHSNQIENNRFYDFHVHMATERYQDIGAREDAYAVPSNKFSDFRTALACMLDDCGFKRPASENLSLFEES